MKSCPKCKSKRWNGRYCKRCNFENTKKKDAIISKSNNGFIPMQFNEKEAEEIIEEETQLTDEEADAILNGALG